MFRRDDEHTINLHKSFWKVSKSRSLSIMLEQPENIQTDENTPDDVNKSKLWPHSAYL